jgi:peroxiredoxin Q/BCP
MTKLKENQKAPDFKSETQEGKTIALKDFLGKTVVLYFYPKDDTPGCTKEACGFRDQWNIFKKAGAVILGVSPDTVRAHQKFVEKFKLPFILVSDEDKSIVKKYGVWGEKQFMGRKYMGVFRTTFLIDADGKIRKIWLQVKPDLHTAEVLEEIGKLKSDNKEN